ncbi:MAG: preprotein translocase subunit YajC [Muribaculaceae bacterium]|nr:preprotein translocase subunit YajC [Muribaculaceae bacterium]
MNLLSILLQQQQGGGWSGMILILAMVVVFYFFMIRPQSKKQKEIKKAREALTKGDKVVTAGGIHGRIKDSDDATFMIEVAPGVTLKVDKGSIYPVAAEKEPVKK